MRNTSFRLSTALTVLLLAQSALAGSYVRYLCQRNMGTTFEPQLTNEIIIVQSKDESHLSVEEFKSLFMNTKTKMNYKLTRYKNIALEEGENPYENLDKLIRDKDVAESFETPHPALTLAGDVHIYPTTKKGERAQFIIKSAMLDSVMYEIFPKGEYFVPKENQRFVCHEPNFFETKVSEEELYLDDQSANFTSY